MISAICCTYGRVRWLEESIAAFLAQECEDAELLVLNTYPGQTLVFDHPRVRIVNLKERPPSLGQARNMAIEQATGEFIVVWDDDDMPLRKHLKTFAEAFTANPEAQWIWLDSQFYSEHRSIKGITAGSCPLFAFTRKAWSEVGGYLPITVGEDQGIIARITEKFPGKKVHPPDPVFIYQWGQGVYHASGQGISGEKTVAARVHADLLQRTQRRQEPTGHIILHPRFARNYEADALAFLGRSIPKNEQTAESKRDLVVVELGAFGDIVNILPVCRHLAEVHSAPHFMVARPFASILDGVSYVIPYVVDIKYADLPSALAKATKEFKHVVCAQVYGGTVQYGPSYNRQSWVESGFGRYFDSWPQMSVVFDKRDKEREALLVQKMATDKPMILVNMTHAVSSPFAPGKDYLDEITRQFGSEFNIVDLGPFRCERIYDVVALMEKAVCLVAVDTCHLHLAGACRIPVVAVVNNGWLGSEPRANVVCRLRYSSVTIQEVCSAIRRTVGAGPAPIRTAVPRKIIHVLEEHSDGAPATMRKQMALNSWKALYAKGVLACPYKNYKRDAKTTIRDPRPLPYLKDVLAAGMAVADPDDIIMWTNDDTILDPGIIDALQFQFAVYGECCSATRIDVPPSFKLGMKIQRVPNTFVGRDLFAWSKSWLESHWDEIGDFILGASDFDLALAAMIRLHYGVESNRSNLERQMPGIELPMGLVFHVAHQPTWAKPANVNSAPSQKHNRSIWREWARTHLPKLVFTPENTI